MSLPNYLWREAVRHATYLINRVATRSLEGMTPYEALRDRKPNLKHLKVFGCVCYGRTEAAGRKKLDDRSRALVHLGTEPDSKAYRLLNPVSKQIVVSRDVLFLEEKEWNWSDPAMTERRDQQGEFAITLRSSNISDRSSVPIDEEDIEDYQSNSNDQEEDNDEDHEPEDEAQPQLRRSNRVTTKPTYLYDYVLIAEAE